MQSEIVSGFKEIRKFFELEEKKKRTFLNTFVSVFHSYLHIYNAIRLKMSLKLKFRCKKALNFGCNVSF